MKRTALLLLLIFAVAVSVVSGCTVNNHNTTVVEKYNGPYAEVDGLYAGTDDLGRVLTENAVATADDKSVGIFYFLWAGTDPAGNNGANTYGPYDNSVTIQKFREQYPEGTFLTSEIWESLGGAQVGRQAYWGKPLFDYYISTDEWVYRKHCQMLTDAGVDYIVFDTTNGSIFRQNVTTLISVWYEYLEQGYDVPKLAFYTHSDCSNTMYQIYTAFYNNSTLKARFPRLDELWYKWPYDGNNKPLIIGSSVCEAGASAATKKNWSAITDYFTIRTYVWPNDVGNPDLKNGFPWMEFSRLYSYSAICGKRGQGVVSVSAAQHYPSVCFSASWYNDPDLVNRTRSFKCDDIFDLFEPLKGHNVTDDDAYLYGYNFADQWAFALAEENIDSIQSVFVTGWNEWVAFRQNPSQSCPVSFVDMADINNSRDVEPMEGGFGDNYYMQLIDNIRKFKGTANRVYVGDMTTVDINGSFSQWNSDGITAVYTDYQNDTAIRFNEGWGTGNYLENYTGRNDFVSLKTCRDENNVYFYAKTAEDITFDGGNPMMLFLDSGNGSKLNWEGYDFAIEITSENKAVLKAADGLGEWKWREIGDCEIKCEGNEIMISVSREAINSPEYYGRQLVDLRFKWTDNCNDPETGTLSISDFYKNGDAAPMGRLNYVFSEAPAVTENK